MSKRQIKSVIVNYKLLPVSFIIKLTKAALDILGFDNSHPILVAQTRVRSET